MDIEAYLDAVLQWADLTPSDSKRVRGELRNHILEMIDNGKHIGLSESEVMQMVTKEFGSPEELGKMIAVAKGRFLTYLKKKARRLMIVIPIAVVIAILVVTNMAAFKVSQSKLLEVPSGSRVLVNKLARSYDVNDVIVFRNPNEVLLGKVKSVQDDSILISRADSEYTISKKSMVGKVILLYSWNF